MNHHAIVAPLLVLLALAGCSSGRVPPTEARGNVATPTLEADRAANYKRSRAEAPPIPIFEEFGVIEGNRLTLRLNPTLLAEQTREVCDSKPFLVPSTWREPKCVLWGIMGCRRYEVGPGQTQPTCLIPNSVGECMRRVSPEPPPPRYEYTKDCYRGMPENGVVGQIDVYAVPDTTPKDKINSFGTRIGSFYLPPDGTPKTLTLPDIPAGQCFGLVDGSGKSISIRDSRGGTNSHLFASAALEAHRAQAALESDQSVKEARLTRAQEDFDRFSGAVVASDAWKNKRCIAPPQEPLPPRPKTLSEAEITMHGKAFCLMLLNDQFDEDVVAKGARAQQKYSFLKAAQALKFDVTRTAECAHGYSYSARDLAYLRGEHMQQNVTEPGLAGILIGMMKGIDQQIRVTQEQRYRMIGSMLEACYSTARSNCRLPLSSWENSVAEVKARPQRIKAQCESDLAQARAANQSIKEAEKALAAAKAAVAANNQAKVSTQAIRLSQAACGAQ
jgi:hypothetical protein